MSYTQLTKDERYQIYILMKAGHNQNKIATPLDPSSSTISRELRQNKGLKGYRPAQVHRLTQTRRSEASRVIKITDEVWGWI